MKKFAALLLAIAMVTMVFTACDKSSQAPQDSEQVKSAQELLENKVTIEIVMESGDIITADLYPDVAPVTVENFLKLVDEDFYAGLIFHRIIPGFMIQGGGFDIDKNQKPADSIYGEFAVNGYNNRLLHKRGVLSMARMEQPYDSASSQFFIMHEEASHLDGQYAAFGYVTSGMDVVDKIASVETNQTDNGPLDPPVIKTIRRK